MGNRNVQLKIKKTDEEQQLVTAEIYAPDLVDSHGDFMRADEIQKMAFGFMINKRMDQVDVNHDNELYGCFVVESFIAREDDSIFIPGSWVVTIFVPDPILWKAIKNGDFNGFSMEASCFKEKDVEIEVESPVALKGHCEKASDGRFHEFALVVGLDGEFLGGRTSPDPDDGHFHTITKAGCTDEANGHTHEYGTVTEVVELNA